MSSRRAVGAVAALTLFLACGTVMAGGEVNLFYGVKNVDLEELQNVLESDFGTSIDNFSDLEQLDEAGILFTYGHDWPVALAVDILFGSSDISDSYSYYYGPSTYGSPYYTIDAKLEYDTWEVDVGIRKYWGGKIQFYLGTGLAFGNAEAKLSGSTSGSPGTSVVQPGISPSSFSESESASDWGLWVNTGLVGRIGEHVNLGLDLRYSSINVDLGPSDDFIRAEAGGAHYGIFVGGRW